VDIIPPDTAAPGQTGHVAAHNNISDVLTAMSEQIQSLADDGGGGTGADKTYTQEFNAASTVTVTHNLGKYPAVTVMDSAGDAVEGDVLFTSSNGLTVSFSAPFSGTVTCN
jgi:selenophosphate synthase